MNVVVAAEGTAGDGHAAGVGDVSATRFAPRRASDMLDA
jgi:hypothetical protein